MPTDRNQPDTVVDLRPVGMYDTGLNVLRPDVDSAVESMLSTGAMVFIYEKRTLMALYKNVSRRNARLPKGASELKLWTHRSPDPEGMYEARWQIRLRQEGELFNPFFSPDQESQYGRWLPLAEKLILGEPVMVDSVREVQCLGQSFRLACDKRGFVRTGRMLRRKKVGRKYEVSLAVPLVRKEKPAARAARRKPSSRTGSKRRKPASRKD
ncbi:MAG: hypothetical protein SFV32_02615 [Opitutaceae bacterium]|nr:hypothetical protein [Opitutaceae bacterium]